MAKKMDGRLDGWRWAVFGGHGRMYRCTDDWVGGQMDGWRLSKGMNGWTS